MLHAAALLASVAAATSHGCPTGVLQRASVLAPVATVLREAQRALARETIESQGRTYHLTPRNAPIDVVARLATAAGFSAPRRVAAAMCGAGVARASWAIHYDLPVSVVAGAGGFPFFVETRSGWRFWGSWCGAGKTTRWRRNHCV